MDSKRGYSNCHLNVILAGAHGRDGGSPSEPVREAAHPVFRAVHTILFDPQAHRRVLPKGIQGNHPSSAAKGVSRNNHAFISSDRGQINKHAFGQGYLCGQD